MPPFVQLLPEQSNYLRRLVGALSELPRGYSALALTLGHLGPHRCLGCLTDCLVHCRMLSSILDLGPPDSSSCSNEKCLSALPKALWRRQNPPPPTGLMLNSIF